ncbi:MAG: helix-turn-helix domain-containing protein, partial [Candidatus Micrarchaeota archaeon]
MFEEELVELGLSANEARVYVALLRAGSSPPAAIAKRTGTHRVYVYDLLEKMVEAGTASVTTEEGKRVYTAAPPQRLLELFRMRLDRLEGIVPQLQRLAEAETGETRAEVLRGRGILRSILKDVLATLSRGGEFLGMGL